MYIMENANTTALLVMDMQTAILKRIPQNEALIKNVNAAIQHARANWIPVMYVVVGFRNGMPEISARNKSFSGAAANFAGIPMEEFLKIHPALAPKDNDIIIIKRRTSAFTGSDLEVILRAKGVQHLVLSGIATSGVVLSTVREAADKDYELTVLADCCADADEEVHHVLTTKIFPRQAHVPGISEWVNEGKFD